MGGERGGGAGDGEFEGGALIASTHCSARFPQRALHAFGIVGVLLRELIAQRPAFIGGGFIPLGDVGIQEVAREVDLHYAVLLGERLNHLVRHIAWNR